MDQLFQLALQYGNGKLTDAGIAWAMEKLGLDQQTQNPKYTYGMPFTSGKLNFNPLNMFKRKALKLGANTLMKGAGSSILPIVGITGLAMFANKYRKQLTGYDTQAAYEAAREERIANKRLDKITDRIISGKNYGNYEDALLDSGAGAVKIDDSITYATDYFPETPKKKAYYDPPNIHNDNNNNNDNSGGNFASQNTGTNESFSNKTGKGRTGYGRGGIASL